MWSRWLVTTNLVILIYQMQFILGAGHHNNHHMQNLKISPKPCEVNGLKGTCMFVWECIKSEGQHVGMCVDSFMFGSCCSHNLTENVIFPQTFSYTRPTKPINQNNQLFNSQKPKPSHHKPSLSGMTTIERPHGAGTLVIRPSGPHHRPTHQKPVITVVNTTVKIPASPSIPVESDLEEAASVSGFTWNTSPQTTQWHITTEPNFITKPRPPSWEKPSMRPKPSKPSKKPVHTTVSPFSDSNSIISSSSSSSSSTRKPTTYVKPSKPQLFYSKPTKPVTTVYKPSSTVLASSSSKPITIPSSSTTTTIFHSRPTSIYPSTLYPVTVSGHYPTQSTINSLAIKPTTPPSKKPTTTIITTKRPSAPSVVKPTSSSTTLTSPTTTSTTTTTAKTTTTTTKITSTDLTTSTINNESNEIDQQTKKPRIVTISAARGVECGVPSLPTRPETRIVGGKNAPFGRWPWQVSVRRTSFFGFSSTHRCGGALINENWIATAGHCVDDLLTSQIRIRVGEYDFSHVQEQLPYIERGVQKKVVHPKYNFFTYEYDLALVKLDQPLIFAEHVSPICLPATDDLLIGMNATVTGWGRLSEGGTLPSVLQEVTVPIVSNDRCKTMFLRAGRQEFIPDIFLCAGYETGGQDSCQGDSGGPLQVKADDSKYFLAGIISWGIGCAEANLPGVCTRISKFVPWIMDNVT